MPSKLPRIGLRIEKDLLEKLHFVAAYNERTANKEVEYLVKRHIAAYESEHGPIEFPAEESQSEAS